MERRVLGEVGVAADSEHIYRILLANPRLSTTELSNYTRLSRSRLRSALAELERLAMITRLSGRPVRFQPSPPDAVVEALIGSREEALRRTRLDARELLTLRRTLPEQVRVTEIVEILTSREAFAQRSTQMQRATHHRIEAFVRPPFAQRRVEVEESLQLDMVKRRVLRRGIYDQVSLAHSEVLEHVWRMVAAGEQAKVVTELPMKLAIYDRNVALVPFIRDDPERTVDSALVVHSSTVLDALITLFDIYWERGIDIQPGVVPSPRQDGTATEDAVLALMSSGLKDEAIARLLGVSAQTVRRRISAMQRRLGVTTRFQAGVVLGGLGKFEPGNAG